MPKIAEAHIPGNFYTIVCWKNMSVIEQGVTSRVSILTSSRWGGGANDLYFD